jgi:hypothetical protein
MECIAFIKDTAEDSLGASGDSLNSVDASKSIAFVGAIEAAMSKEF